MARRKKGRRGGKRGIRIGGLLGIVGGAYGMYRTVKGFGAGNEARAIGVALTGYDYGDGSFNWKSATYTIPAFAGCGLSMVASKVGLNRYTPKGINI